MNKSEKFGFDCIVLWGLCGESWVVFVGIMKLMYKEERAVLQCVRRNDLDFPVLLIDLMWV